MLKTLLTATAASALMLSAALAQTSTTPTMPSTPPAAQQAPDASPSPMGSATATPHFVASQQPDQLLMSKFKGTNVLGPDNEKVGDVNDVLFDKSGKVLAVIVGVGGFLGIGQKDVGIEMSSFQVVPATAGSSTTSGSSAANNDPTDISLKIAMTKDQLKNAPSFEHYKAPSRTTSTPSTTNTGMAPRNGATTPPTSR
jgi:hypothetical protein